MTKAEYEARRRQKREMKMQEEDALAKRRRREAESDALSELLMKAATAFLTGKAHISVESDGVTRRKVTFVMPE